MHDGTHGKYDSITEVNDSSRLGSCEIVIICNGTVPKDYELCHRVLIYNAFRHIVCLFFFQAEDGIRDYKVTGVQTCALPIFSANYAPFTVDDAGGGIENLAPSDGLTSFDRRRLVLQDLNNINNGQASARQTLDRKSVV